MIFEGKNVLITGAGMGVGRGLAAGFAKDGANVVGLGRTQSALDETAQEYCAGRMLAIGADVSSAQDVERAVSEAESHFGGIDILINNAAIYPKQLFLESDIEDWAHAIDINVVGMARMCHRVLPGMLERRSGRILNVGSYAWKGPIPKANAYSVSKGAVHILTKSLAVEVDPATYPDVLINEFLPGIVHTRMTPEGGDDPMGVYAHASLVASLPAGGPHGQVFLKSELDQEDAGGSGLKRLVKRLLGRG